MAGLIKVILALQHQEIPPNLHLNKLNPYIRLNKTPLSIPTTKQSWTVEEKRLAGISSFGFGGTNAHVIVEQAPIVESVKAKKERSRQLLTLSAKNKTALAELAEKYSDFLNSNPAVSLADLCFNANAGRTHFEHRLMAIASSSTELQTSLQAFALGENTARVTTSFLSMGSRPQIAFLFTGQGSQYIGMGKELYETQPTFRQALDRCADILTSYLDRPLQEIIYSSTSPIDQTKYTQPAIFAIEYALAQLWQSWGIQPSVVMGHSVGEYVAACVAGVFSLADGLKLIAERGRLMQSLPQNGSMVSLLAEPDIVLAAMEPYKKDVALAAYNGSNNTVISGKTAVIEDLVSQLESQGIKTKYLQVSHGFHSPLMQPMLADFAQVAQEITYSSPQIDLISNVTGEGVTRDSGIRQGYFNGYFIENGWFWFIPLSSDIMSVGVVMNEPETNGWSHRSPEEILLTYINRYQFIRDRFENAEQSSKIRMLRGLPYSSKQTVGNGWILVGDANFFVDPLYSSGVHIAFHSAEKAAEAIAIFLQGKRNIKPFKQYAKWSEKYQFHVFTTMSLLYGMLKDRVAMETYIKLSGKYSNHWNNPILRRVNAWGTGHFDKFYLALYSTWIFSFLLLTLILSFYYYFHLWDLTIASIQNYDFMINNLV